MARHPIALTPGEPAGIGPDLCIQLAQTPRKMPLVVVADPHLLQNRADALGLEIRLRPWQYGEPTTQRAGELSIRPVALERPVRGGQLDPANAAYVLETLRHACDDCLQGRVAALVTGPVHKGVINEAGIPFSGHTEFLAARCGGARPVMMLAAPGLRVALATTHLPLAEVARHITSAGLEEVIRVLHHDLRARFGLPRPRILVCGLNPHAGEGGHLGREEIEIIAPLLKRLCAEGMTLEGPLPADTLFTPPFLERADAVLAMYHDQGLPVLKHLGFGRAVNITLGLPIIRTSVDHGTALDLAGSGRASVTSLEAALDAAATLAQGE